MRRGLVATHNHHIDRAITVGIDCAWVNFGNSKTLGAVERSGQDRQMEIVFLANAKAMINDCALRS